jgi:hypothetical protein
MCKDCGCENCIDGIIFVGAVVPSLSSPDDWFNQAATSSSNEVVALTPCPACCCGRILFNHYQEETKEMIAYQGEQTSATPAGRGGPRSGIPFLKLENIHPSELLPMTISAVKTGKDQKGKDQITLKILYRGVAYLFSPRLNNPNVKHLIDLFGADETKWSGKECLLGQEPDDFSGRNWPRIFPAKATKAK